ncbi:MAG: type I-C CRISPR-associated protein Cas5c, partial [Fimbriimonadaceae bacterium]
MKDNYATVRIRGEFACFTRPENKVERVTYPVITPSAARGVLEAIYWHPQFAWAVREIRVLNPVRTYSLLRNEVNSKMSAGRAEPYFADEDRAQRHSVCLRDVDYVVAAEVRPKPGTEPSAKHLDIFSRRVARGQCHHQPALGCREFAAEFGPAEGAPEPI